MVYGLVLEDVEYLKAQILEKEIDKMNWTINAK